MFKVLIHELIHYLDWDIKRHKFNTSHIKIDPRSEKPMLPNEAYTESLAIAYYCYFFKRDIGDEMKFMHYQIEKILNHYGFDSLEKFKEDNNGFIQNTSVVSYYIIKYMMVRRMPDIVTVQGNREEMIKFVQDVLDKFYIYGKKMNLTGKVIVNEGDSLRMTLI
jgi:hypothetical protein